MNERGWGWSASEIRQVHLAEWLAGQEIEPNLMYTVTEFYENLPDQTQNNWDTAHGDLKRLEARGMVSVHAALGGIDGLGVVAKSPCRDFANEIHAQRENKGQRRTACRDAMVDWLHGLDAISAGPDMPVRDTMLEDSRHGVWFGQPFTAADLDQAAAWLHRNGLADGIMINEAHGPVRLYLTDEGVRCAGDFNSDTSAYMTSQRGPVTSGPSVHIGTNSGPFQVAGDHAHQVQNIGTNADDLRQLISSLAEMARTLAPDADGVDEREQEALAAVVPGSVNLPVLRRFAQWVVSLFAAGTRVAMVPAIAAAANEMITKAEHIL